MKINKKLKKALSQKARLQWDWDEEKKSFVLRYRVFLSEGTVDVFRTKSSERMKKVNDFLRSQQARLGPISFYRAKRKRLGDKTLCE